MPGTLDGRLTPPSTSSASASQQQASAEESRDYNGRSWSRNSRNSESSESLDNQSTSSGTCGKMLDFGSTEFIPTRSTKTAPKVAYNPMQFVKTGPTKLAMTAQEQLKKAEEVKKIREKKRDDAEDWQSNLEGWKSSRRKRQEHVIERVTEVKRMEQEEALKAAEAAAKRLIGIREKRGKLSALYSVEDNDEIEFITTTTSQSSRASEEDRSQEAGDNYGDDSVFDTSQKSEVSATSSSPDQGKRRHSPEYTYDKAIEDYVKFSTTALSSTTSSNSSRQETHQSEAGQSKKERVPVRQTPSVEHHENLRAKSKSPVRPTPSVEHHENFGAKSKSPDTDQVLVVQRRSVFERTVEDNGQVNIRSMTSSTSTNINRRSGEFSSAFKSKLSTFEVAEQDGPARQSVVAASTKVTSEGSTTGKMNVVPDEEPQPDFKAKLAVFRQVEASKSAPNKATLPAKEEAVRSKPSLVARSVVPSAKPETAEKPVRSEIIEPIYANSSVTVVQQPPACPTEPPPPLPDNFVTLRPEASESSSDCTEDEGIRSLSPHGTPSPTSPSVGQEPAEVAGSARLEEPEQFSYKINTQEKIVPSKVEEAAPPAATSWTPLVEMADWVSDFAVGRSSAPAPPKEKPPPPPVDDDDDVAPPPVKAPERSEAVAPPAAESASYRHDLRKRRSDFLGFDVKAMEDDAKEMADAIPPPPDLKSLLRSAADYGNQPAGQGRQPGMPGWDSYSSSSSAVNRSREEEEEDELAAKERQIIEILEKEEEERRLSSGSDSHNRSHDGIEYELTAEIDQLAREWRADAMGLTPTWKMTNQKVLPPLTEDPSVVLRTEIRPQQSSPVRAPVQQPPQLNQNAPRDEASSPASETINSNGNAVPRESTGRVQQTIAAQQQDSPPKPSRLSAAPKPRFHDGEAWMAKRKVASEGGAAVAGGAGQTGQQPRKDISKHWLIQEAEQRRIDAMQERNYSPSSSSISSIPSNRGIAGQQQAPISAISPSSVQSSSDSTNLWMSRSSSATSMDRIALEQQQQQHQLIQRPDQLSGQHRSSSRSTSSLGPSPQQQQHLYANQEEILEFADFTGAPHTAPPVWQVRSLVTSGSMDQLHQAVMPPPSRPFKHSKSQTLPTVQQQQNHEPSWRSTQPPAEIVKEPIAPLPHSVIHTLTQRMNQRTVNSNNYGDYMNLQEAQQQKQQQATAQAAPMQAPGSSNNRAGPQVPAQRPANYRHPSLGPTHSAPSVQRQPPGGENNNERMLSVSGKKKCSLCQEELGRGAAMIIESLRLFYHINCFRCCVCGVALGNGTAGTDVRVRNNNLHCHDCYSNDDGLKFSKV